MDNNQTALPKGFRLHGNHRDYKIDKTLGQGGFGITYRATGPVQVGTIVMQVDFCLKEFFLSNDCERLGDSSISYSNPARTRVENSRKDFIAEAQRLKKVGFRHPNIVGFDEVFEANNTAYYVMEYINGSSLDQYVTEHGALSEQEVRELLWPILDAVKLLHQNRICHLDIKPANIMLARDSEGRMRPVLIDFGLSKHYDSKGHATSTINSFGYSEGYAPVEQYKGITTFSPGADLYALGATMWHCLTAIDPPSALDLRDGELAAQLPASVSQELRTMIDIMTRDPRTRPTSLDEVERLTAEALKPKIGPKPEVKTESAGKATVVLDAPAVAPSSSKVGTHPGASVTPPKPPKPVKPVIPETPGVAKVTVAGEMNPVRPSGGKNKTLFLVLGGIAVAIVILVVLFVIGSSDESPTDNTDNTEEIITTGDNAAEETEIGTSAQEAQPEQAPAQEAAPAAAPARQQAAPAKTTKPAAQKPATQTQQPTPQKPAKQPVAVPEKKKTDKAHNSTTPYTMDF